MVIQPNLTHCRLCLAPIRLEASGEPVRCHCGVEATLFVYPALRRTAVQDTGEAIQAQGESACFAHPGKRAVAACEKCGRFVCGLCRIEWGDTLLCPACVAGAEKRTDLLVTSRPLYDSMALASSTFSLIILYLSVFTAPFAVWLSIRSLKSPGSLTPRTKIRAWLAILLSVAQVVGWIWLFTYLILKQQARTAS